MQARKKKVIIAISILVVILAGILTAYFVTGISSYGIENGCYNAMDGNLTYFVLDAQDGIDDYYLEIRGNTAVMYYSNSAGRRYAIVKQDGELYLKNKEDGKIYAHITYDAQEKSIRVIEKYPDEIDLTLFDHAITQNKSVSHSTNQNR